MKRSKYWPVRQGDQITWLTTFMNNLDDAATALGLTTAQVTAIKADCAWLIYVLGAWLPAVRQWARGCTNAATEAQTGTGGSPQVLPVFPAPDFPTGVTAVNPGALDRLFALVQQIKDGGKCTDTLALELGIVGSEDAGPDFTTLQPWMTLRVQSGRVFVDWNWGGWAKWLDSCEIWVDRNDGKGFVLLTIDTTPGYLDTQPWPATLTKWTYKATFRVGDEQAGLWCTPLTITVPA